MLRADVGQGALRTIFYSCETIPILYLLYFINKIKIMTDSYQGEAKQLSDHQS